MEAILTKGNITKSLIKFSLPIMLSLLMNQFYSIADSMIIGSFLGAKALAAVSNGASILLIFLFISGGMELGSNLLIATSLNSGKEELSRISYNLLFFDFVISIVLLIIGQFTIIPLLNLINTPASILNDALVYTRIYLIGLPFMMLYCLFQQMLIGLGDSKYPMYAVIITSLLNIVLDLLFIYGLNLGIAYGAIATVIAQIVGFLICYPRVYKKMLHQRFSISNIKLKYFKEMMSLVLPSILQQLTAPIGVNAKQSLLGSLGVNAIAGFSAASRLETFLILPLAAFSNSLVIFIAQNHALNQDDRVKEGIKKIKIIMAIICVIVLVLCIVMNKGMLLLFTDNKEAIKFGQIILTHNSWFYMLFALRLIYEGKLRAYRKMSAYTFSNISNTAINILFSYLFVASIGFNGFYLATWVTYVLGALLSYGLSKKLT